MKPKEIVYGMYIQKDYTDAYKRLYVSSFQVLQYMDGVDRAYPLTPETLESSLNKFI